VSGGGRMVKVGGADLHFATIEKLEERAKEEENALHALNDGALARNPRDGAAWAKVEQHATILRDLVFGLDQWIRAEEEALDSEIATLRYRISSLGGEVL